MGLSEYMLYGGIPLVVLREGANDKAVALQNLFNEIYLRDITKRNRVRNIGELEDLSEYSFLCHWFADQSGKTEKYFQDGKEIQNHFRYH